MFTSEVPSYVVDLGLPEAERWAEVIAAEKENARQLIDRAAADLERVPKTARWTFGQLYRMFGGLYQGEIAAWAEALGVSVGTATMLNCLYELSHLPQPKWLGCTAGICWMEGHGMVHVRTLDWPIEGMGEATRLFRFKKGNREFVSIAMPGQVGMLSGMLPGAYSVTINWAPPAALPNFDFGPGFLLRDVFETCDTYDAAVNRLTKEPLSTSVFYTVCGTEKAQACVIERTQAGAAVRPFTGKEPLVQANHHIAPTFARNNEAIREVPPEEEVFSIDGSTKRVKIMQDGLAALPATCSLEAMAAPLDVPTVLNSQTCQKMVFCPATGELKLWRLLRE